MHHALAMSNLTRIVAWSHELVREVLRPGDLAVDLTAGKGRDTLVLAAAVGQTGQVVAFDTQAVALEQASAFLERHGCRVHNWSGDRELTPGEGIFLVQACHSSLGKVVTRPVRAVMANLGYLPGGDHALVTRPETTLPALVQSLDLLLTGGRLAVTVYPAHPGGEQEAQMIDDFFATLTSDIWQVLTLRVANHGEAPSLLVAERRC